MTTSSLASTSAITTPLITTTTSLPTTTTVTTSSIMDTVNAIINKAVGTEPTQAPQLGASTSEQKTTPAVSIKDIENNTVIEVINNNQLSYTVSDDGKTLRVSLKNIDGFNNYSTFEKYDNIVFDEDVPEDVKSKVYSDLGIEQPQEKPQKKNYTTLIIILSVLFLLFIVMGIWVYKTE